jgi:hypothetical protein
MRYFRLLDDLLIPGRWHLGNVSLGGVDKKVVFDSRQVLEVDDYEIEVSRDGRSLEFSQTSFGIPVARDGLALEIEGVAGHDVQLLACQIFGAGGFTILNCVRQVMCLDEERSTFDKWGDADSRPDLIGHYRTVYDLKVNAAQVPDDAHLFRISKWPVALIVSQTLKEAMEAADCFGARFLDVTG